MRRIGRHLLSVFLGLVGLALCVVSVIFGSDITVLMPWGFLSGIGVMLLGLMAYVWELDRIRPTERVGVTAKVESDSAPEAVSAFGAASTPLHSAHTR